MKNFTKEVDEWGVMTVYGDNGYWQLAEIGECGELSEVELNSLADECLNDLGYIKGNYFTAETDEEASKSIAKGERN